MKKIWEFFKKLLKGLTVTSTEKKLNEDGPGNPPPTPPGKGNG